MGKPDDLLLKTNDFLSSITDKITPNIVLLVALLNGFIVALSTTGYFGEASISVKSLTFGLIVWQFLVICVFSAKYITLTVEYLNKFLVTGAAGFFIQWQIFGMYAASYDEEMLKNIQPVVDNGAGTFFASWMLFMILKYCFSENEGDQKPTDQFKLSEDK